MDSDLFNYPFLSDVWGTAADWAIFGVTTATLLYLVRTLKSQLKVQQLQQKVTMIENERFRMDHEPYWECERIGMISELVGLKMQCTFTFHATLTGSPCKNLNFVLDPHNFDSIEYEPFDTNYHTANIGNEYFLTIQSAMDKEVFLASGAKILIIISFDDLVNNKYSQEVELKIGDVNSITNDEKAKLHSI